MSATYAPAPTTLASAPSRPRLAGPLSRSSPRTTARMIGGLFLSTIVLGIFAEGFVSGRIVVPRDAAATATNILAHQSLYRAGFTAYLIEMAAQIAMTVFFYELLKPVSRPLSLLSAVFSYVGCGIKTMSRLFYLAPVFVLSGATYAAVFNPAQRQALTSLLLQLNNYGAGIALAFFGVSTVVQGYLILRSTFLPRSLGIVTILGGLGWMTFLSPSLGLQLFPIVAGIGLLGSIAMILWLLIVGVDERRWQEQADVRLSS
jgi:hypothetical protein